MTLTTPKAISEQVYRLRAKIGVDTEPVFVSVSDTDGFAINECFPNVRHKIARDGGFIQYGWMVWEWPNKLIEGEFHAVWVAPDGGFRDITPKPDGEKRILFIPDPERVYQNIPIGTVRLPLTDAPEIHQMILLAEDKERLRLKYNDGSGQPKIPAHELLALERRHFGLPQAPVQLPPKTGRNQPCPCRSGKKFKNCHGAL